MILLLFLFVLSLFYIYLLLLQGSLICFRRSALEYVPGCSGDGSTGTDYCFVRPTNYLITSDTLFPLGLCTGDCDSDFDCEEDLICQKRDGLSEILGCVGTGEAGSDYCISRLTNDYLITSEIIPLGLCTGDCDSDFDCERDLICEQRDGFDAIPGCTGNGVGGIDYCRFPYVTSATEEAASATATTNPTPEELDVLDGNDVQGTASPTTPAPITSTPITSEPTTSAPITSEPITSEPTTSSPITSEPTTSEPTTSEPTTSEPTPPNPSPTDQPSVTCHASGEVCLDKKKCCTGFCEKDETTGEKVCGWIPGTNPNSSDNNSPSATDDAACTESGKLCLDKKKCCTGLCEKDNATNEEICSWTTAETKPAETKPSDVATCTEYGEPCVDKKKCCTGFCEIVTGEEICGRASADEAKPTCISPGRACFLEKNTCCNGLCSKKEENVAVGVCG